MLIKVCGMREKKNIRELCELDIQMMGLIFYEKSKRFVEYQEIEGFIDIIPSHIKKVGVFVNSPIESVKEKVKKYGLEMVQLHGDESVEYCEELSQDLDVMKAFRVDQNFDFRDTWDYKSCKYLLFDAKGKEYGGNGIKYDWNILQNYKNETPFLLSGGIGPDDYLKIINFDHPHFAGIDINSGFEDAPGIKNITKIRTFINHLACNTL